MTNKDKEQTIIDLYNDWKSTFDKARTDRPGSLSGAQERFFLNFLHYVEGLLREHYGDGQRALPLTSVNNNKVVTTRGTLRRSRRERDVGWQQTPTPSDEDNYGDET